MSAHVSLIQGFHTNVVFESFVIFKHPLRKKLYLRIKETLFITIVNIFTLENFSL